MLSTCAATLRALSASTVTVATCPALTLPISDSLSGTTSCIDSRWLSTAKAPLEEPVEPLDEDEAPAEEAPAEEAPLVPVEELELLEALVVPVPETVSPTSP